MIPKDTFSFIYFSCFLLCVFNLVRQDAGVFVIKKFSYFSNLYLFLHSALFYYNESVFVLKSTIMIAANLIFLKTCKNYLRERQKITISQVCFNCFFCYHLNSNIIFLLGVASFLFSVIMSTAKVYKIVIFQALLYGLIFYKIYFVLPMILFLCHQRKIVNKKNALYLLANLGFLI